MPRQRKIWPGISPKSEAIVIIWQTQALLPEREREPLPEREPGRARLSVRESVQERSEQPPELRLPWPFLQTFDSLPIRPS